MLPGVSTRGLLVIEPMPPTIVPYTGPPLASGPWHATHLVSYTCLPAATVPRPGGSPSPSGVRTSMFTATRSASATGWPNFGRSGSGCTGWGEVLPRKMPSAVRAIGPCAPPLSMVAVAHAPSPSARTTAAPTCLRLADDIGHLPVGAYGPRLDRVVVLDEADDGPDLREVGHRGLHVSGAVHRAAHQHRGLAV